MGKGTSSAGTPVQDYTGVFVSDRLLRVVLAHRRNCTTVLQSGLVASLDPDDESTNVAISSASDSGDRHGAAAGVILFFTCVSAVVAPLAIGAVGDAFGGI